MTITRPEIARALHRVKSIAAQDRAANIRHLDGHYRAMSATVGALRLSARYNRAGMEEISVSYYSKGQAAPLPPDIVDRVVDVHMSEFGVALKPAVSMPGRDGLAWVVLHHDNEHSAQQERLL